MGGRSVYHAPGPSPSHERKDRSLELDGSGSDEAEEEDEDEKTKRGGERERGLLDTKTKSLEKAEIESGELHRAPGGCDASPFSFTIP